MRIDLEEEPLMGPGRRKAEQDPREPVVVESLERTVIDWFCCGGHSFASECNYNATARRLYFTGSKTKHSNV